LKHQEKHTYLSESVEEMATALAESGERGAFDDAPQLQFRPNAVSSKGD